MRPSFDQNKANGLITHIGQLVAQNQIKAYDLMQRYKKCIVGEDYETAFAIHKVLEPTAYEVTDTHSHIPSINRNKWTELRLAREDGFKGTLTEWFR